MDVEHLWFSKGDLTSPAAGLEAAGSEAVGEDDAMVQTLANMADKRLYKLVKWCKSLPLFKNIVVGAITQLSLHSFQFVESVTQLFLTNGACVGFFMHFRCNCTSGAKLSEYVM